MQVRAGERTVRLRYAQRSGTQDEHDVEYPSDDARANHCDEDGGWGCELKRRSGGGNEKLILNLS